jgi:adenine-specific DNA-methyltransferase
MGSFVWRRRITSSLSQSWLSTDHEYVLVYSKKPSEVEILGEKKDQGKYNKDDGDGRKYASMPLTVGMNKFQRPNQWYALIHPKTKKEYWPPENRVWCYFPPTMSQKILENRIIWPDNYPDSRMTTPRLKSYIDESQRDRKPVSTWIREVSDETVHEEITSLISARNEEGTKWLNKLFRMSETVYPKPLSLLLNLNRQFVFKKDVSLDFFAGSGTTAHAVINLNREDNGQRKYILVEQGEYFDTVLKPRIQKVVYSADWKDGKATAPETGISHAFKVLKIESYEDTLNNLQLKRDDAQQTLFDELPQHAQDDYLLRYMLEIESRDSLLSVTHFNKPFDCRLKVTVDSAGAYEERTIDLVETFNYLIGLRVKHIDMQLDKDFVTVTGWLPSGEKTLVLWRDVERVDYDQLNRLCDKLAINPADSEFEVVYINGDHNIPAVFTSSEEEGGITKTLKIRQIETEFLSRMFAVDDV